MGSYHLSKFYMDSGDVNSQSYTESYTELSPQHRRRFLRMSKRDGLTAQSKDPDHSFRGAGFDS